jgi:hypothetical protein
MRSVRTLVCFAVVLFFAALADAHPGAAIAVDARGNVYFADTLRGVWKIDTAGTLTFLGPPNFHYFALDEDNLFARFKRRTAEDEIHPVTRVSSPTLLASSDFAVVVSRGGLYFAPTEQGKPLALVRATPDGTTTAVATLPALRWLNGIAGAPDGSIYGTADAGILRIDRSGAVTWFARDVKVPDCRKVDALDEMPAGPYLRGLSVSDTDLDATGAVRTIYAAATACGAVIKISQSGTISTILRTNGSWAPTAVAAAGGSVYVLEYDHSVPERTWPPRVRKLDASGKVTVLATITR